MRRARTALEEALGKCQEATERARLLEDEQRFAYAEATVEFLCQLTCLAAFEQQENHDLARYAFEKLEAAAERLKQFDLSLIETYACPDDGLAATLALPKYEKLLEKYKPE